MIGPVSGTGRTMMASLQQAIQKGMPPDQAIQYVKSMATQGVAPLTDLYAMMNQFQRLKQQPVQAPQTPPTIRDQLNMAEQQQAQQQMAMQQQAQQQMAMQQGLGGMPVPAMEQAQFAGGGIVAFAAGSEDPVSSRSGGTNPYEFNADLLRNVPSFMTDTTDIESFVRKQMPDYDKLSFAEKQEVLKRFDPAYKEAYRSLQTLKARGAAPAPAITPAEDSTAAFDPNAFRRGPENVFEQVQDLRRIQERATTAPDVKPAAPERQNQGPVVPRVAAPAAPKGDMFTQFERSKTDVETERAARIERQRAAKTGEFSQADADLAAYIKEQKAQGGDTKEAYRNFWVMTGASLMANKSPYFMQALGESIRDNYGGLVNDLKQLKDNTKSLRLQEIQLRRAQEQAMESGSTADQDRVDRLNEKADATNFAITSKRFDIEQKALDHRHDIALERLRASNRPSNLSIAERLMGMYDAAVRETDPVRRQELMGEYERQLQTAENITRATTAAGIGLPVREAGLVQREATGIRGTRAYIDAERRYNLAKAKFDIAGANAAQAEMDQMLASARQQITNYMGGDSSPVPTSGGGAYTGPITTSGWNQ
jgi:hypothetical protein